MAADVDRQRCAAGLYEGPQPVELKCLPGATRYLRCKALAEWLLALVLMALAAPVVAVFACLIPLTSPGPAFYRQTRLGRHGRTYSIYKLRTMNHNCEGATGPVWATPDDPRVTRLGRFLRDTHLDELPQLWNVLRGEMGLIGPRPERPEIAAEIDRVMPGYRVRLLIRPGITGLAQMKLPADSDLDGLRRKLAQDLYYLRHMSPLLDLRVGLATVFHFLGTAATALSKALVRSCGHHAEGNAVDPAAALERRGNGSSAGGPLLIRPSQLPVSSTPAGEAKAA